MSSSLRRFMRELVKDADEVTLTFDNASISMSFNSSCSTLNHSLSGWSLHHNSSLAMDNSSHHSTGSSRWDSIPVVIQRVPVEAALDATTQGVSPQATREKIQMVPKRPTRQLSKR